MKTCLPTMILILFTAQVSFVFAQPRDEFRVDTKVYIKSGRSFKQIQTNRTLFRLSETGRPEAYDFLDGNNQSETVLLDLSQQHVVILDPEREVKCELTFFDINRFVLAQKNRATPNNMAFFAPKFQVTKNGNTLTFASEQVSYEVKMQKVDIPRCHSLYEEFTSWYAKLNAMRPNNPPPSGRLEVSKQISAAGMVPKSISRTTQRNQATLEAKSEHTFVGGWNRNDRRLVQVAQNQLNDFQAIAHKEFFFPTQVAATPAEKR